MQWLDRIRGTTSSTGNTTKAIDTAAARAHLPLSGLSAGGLLGYIVAQQEKDEFEVGLGTYTAGVLTPVKIIASSNAGAAVTFTTGLKDVMLTVPAAFIDGAQRFKKAVVCVPTANVTTLAPGVSQDGHTLAAGERVGLVNQSTLSQNGLYEVVAGGALTRSVDLWAGADAAGIMFVVTSGTVYGGSVFMCAAAPGSDVVGTNNLTFTRVLSTTPLPVAQGGTGSTTAAGARTNLGVTATGADTTYTFRANNLSDLASAATARTNLGVTATGADTTYTFRANNLSDLASAATARTNLGVTIGSDVQAYDAGLANLAAYNTDGIVCQSANNTFVGRTMAAPAAGMTITNPGGVAGNPTFVLANDLAGVEGLSGTGIAGRSATDTWVVNSITTNRVPKGNGAGVIADSRFIDTGTLAGVTASSPNYAWDVVATANSSQFQLITNSDAGSSAEAAIGADTNAGFVALRHKSTAGGGAGTVQCSAGRLNITMSTATIVGAVTTRGNLIWGTTTDSSGTDGKCMWFGDNGGNPTPGAATGGVYAKTVVQTEVFVIDSAGTATQISPHPESVMSTHAENCRLLGLEPVVIPWGYESHQLVTGTKIIVDLALLTRLVEVLASKHYGSTVELVRVEQTEPEMKWDERNQDSEKQWADHAAVYDKQLEDWMAKPVWARDQKDLPTLGDRPKLTAAPEWLAKMMDKKMVA